MFVDRAAWQRFDLQGGAVSRPRAIIDIPAEARPLGFYWIVLGSKAPEVAWSGFDRRWSTDNALPWPEEEIAVRSDRLVLRPQPPLVVDT